MTEHVATTEVDAFRRIIVLIRVYCRPNEICAACGVSVASVLGYSARV